MYTCTEARVLRGFMQASGLLGLWLVSLFAFAFAGEAQRAAPAPPKYVTSILTMEDGLPDNTINAIAQTRNGVLWVGTGAGLVSFDGHTFTRVQLPIPGGLQPSSINSLLETRDGSLWIGSDAGVMRITKEHLANSSGETFENFRLGHGRSDEVLELFQDAEDTVWAGSNHGLYRWDGRGFLPVLLNTYISRIKGFEGGRLLLITGSGPAIFEQASSRLTDLPSSKSLGLPLGDVFDVFKDQEGALWYCTREGIRVAGLSGIHGLAPSQAATTATYREVQSANGERWVITGIGVYRIAGDTLEAVALSQTARAFFVGRDGDLWVGTNGHGLEHLHRETVRMYTEADGLIHNLPMALLRAHNGELWVGNNCGLDKWDGKNFHHVTEVDGLLNSCVYSLAQDGKEDLWIGTYGGGLFRFRNGRFTQFTREQRLVSRIVSKITVAHDGSIWAATPDGLSRLTGTDIKNYTTGEGLLNNQVLDVLEDSSGQVWAATRAGVARLAGARFVRVPAPGVPDTVLQSKLEEDSRGNVFTLDEPRGISVLRQGRFYHQDLPLTLSGMAKGEDGTLWFASTRGILRMREEELFAQEPRENPAAYEQFGRADGLASLQPSVGMPNIVRTTDGEVWLATTAGLAMLNTKTLPPAHPAPEAFVAEALVDGERQHFTSQLVLPPSLYHVELRFAAIDLATPDKIRLQYRLEGADPTWLDAGASRSAVYTGLPNGSHRLFVKTTNSSGRWGKPRVVLEVIQTPHLWQRPLVIMMVASLTLVLLAVAYQIRLRGAVAQARKLIEARQAERELIARDLHDTFLQNVNGLVLFFDSATRRLPSGDPVREVLEAALQRADEVLREGRSLLRKLTVEREASHSLAEAYAKAAQEFSSVSPAKCLVDVHGEPRELESNVCEELSRLGREALFNAFQHAQAGSIHVLVYFSEIELQLRFGDDGVGIEPELLRTGRPGHFGLSGMAKRAEAIGASFSISSVLGRGTEIVVRVPAAKAFKLR